MNFLERINYIGKLSFEKQFVIAIMSAERAYQEVIKVFPKSTGKRPVFRKGIDILWKYVQEKDSVSKQEIEEIDKEIFNYVEDELDMAPGEAGIIYHTIVTALARSINLSLGMITLGIGKKSGRTSANVVQKEMHIFDTIYENPEDTEKAYKTETEWVTKAIYLVAENEEIPTDYSWFLERNPDYEREKIYKKFDDIG